MWQSAQDFPASARARGGATVTRLELTLQFGNRSLISVLPTPRTSGLLGLLIKKSCHKMMPPLLSSEQVSQIEVRVPPFWNVQLSPLIGRPYPSFFCVHDIYWNWRHVVMNIDHAGA